MMALIITSAAFEDMELFYPLYRLREAGLDVDVASERTGTLQGIHGYRVDANMAFPDVQIAGYDLLILPGGRAPQVVRKNEQALDLVRDFFRRDKPLAAICHGPQILISAGLAAGRKMTAYHKVRPELAAAGAQVQDAPVVVDGRLITSREPKDLPFFCREIMRALGEPGLHCGR